MENSLGDWTFAAFQIDYILQLLERVGDKEGICATQPAMDDFNTRRIKAAKSSIWMTGCKSWYLDKDGIPASWPWSYSHFAEVMETPDFSAYEMIA